VSPLAALALTLVVEVPLYTAGLVGLGLARPARAALLAVGLNLLTHPAVWWALAPRPGPLRFGAAELAVCAVEAGLLWLAIRRDPGPLAVVSVGANAASVLAGLLITAVA
jgi:hypothetical protein